MSTTDPNDSPATRTRRAILPAALGLLVGAVAAAMVPASWLFVAPQHDTREHAQEGVQYACPMFCVVVDQLPEDGRCPVCGMQLGVVSGESTLNEAEQQMVGLELGVVRRVPLEKTLRLVGEVDYDETRLARITTRVGGWLETLWIDATWTEVSKGEPLAAIYSPELYQAEKEYLVALDRLGDGDRGSLLHAAERRLNLLGVDEQEIAELQKNGTARDSVVLRAPIGGVVVERRALEGASVDKGAVLYTVADLSRVWIQALVFESDLPWVRVGQTVKLLPEGSAEPLFGSVAFVDPAIDRASRTARLRIEVDNPKDAFGQHSLRVGQRVDAVLMAKLDGDGRLLPPGGIATTAPLAVPRSAVLRTGERQLVYVLFTELKTDRGVARDDHLDPTAPPPTVWYEPVEVVVGPLATLAGGATHEEYYPLLTHGDRGSPALTEGTTIALRGNLLLDSQAQLSGKPSLLYRDGNRGAASPHSEHQGH